MKKCLGKGILSVFLALIYLSLSANRAYSQAVVTDTQSTGKTIKQWFTEVKESKTVVGTMQTIQKTNAAIGSAKKSVSEYVIKNKEKLEEKLAKVQEYKRKAEEYKKEYDEYKKQLDENIAKAKELKEQAEAKIDEAKDTVAAAQATIEAAQAKADEIVDAAKEKTDGVLGAGTSSEETTSEEGAKTPESTTVKSDSEQPIENVLMPKEEEAKVIVPETPSSETSIRTPTSSRKAFGGALDNVNKAELVVPEENVQSVAISDDQKSLATGATPTEVTPTGAMSAEPTQGSTSNVNLDKTPIFPQQTGEENIGSRPSEISAQPAKVQQGIQLRKAFTTSSLHRSETLMFAKVELLNLPDGGTDANGVVIIPKALALYCGLNSSDSLKAGVMDECLLKLNKERQNSQVFSGSDAPKIYNLAMAQYAAANIAEAYKARQDADSFEEKFIDAIDFAPETTARDVYDNIVELNKAIDMQMNGLLRVFSSQLAVQSLYNYGNYSFVPQEQEEGGTDE